MSKTEFAKILQIITSPDEAKELEPTETQQKNREITQKNIIHAKNILIQNKQFARTNAIITACSFFLFIAILTNSKHYSVVFLMAIMAVSFYNLILNKNKSQIIMEKYGLE
jgi:hypothetical protein